MPKRLNLPRATVNAFRRNLPPWYHRNSRPLPWRATRDPYRIWVSEIMLQQTRVEVVIDYYRRWLREFPTLKSLARAPFPRVLKLWEGLGYYTRARNLHRAAKLVRGKLPGTVAGLLALPGIGRYTAGAIASIAFGERAPVVDGNVARVLARVFGSTGNFWEIAERLLPEKNCGDFNQALMELGALVCVPANPRCDACPLWRVCVTRGDALPVRKRRRIRPVTHDVLFAQCDGKVLLRQRPPTGLLAGLWELPAGKSARHLLTLRHAITNQKITLRVFGVRRLVGAVPGGLRTERQSGDKSPHSKAGKQRWFTRRQLLRVTMPAAHRRALARLTSTPTALRPRPRRARATRDTG